MNDTIAAFTTMSYNFATAFQYPTMLLGGVLGAFAGYIFGNNGMKNLFIRIFKLVDKDNSYYGRLPSDESGFGASDKYDKVRAATRSSRRRGGVDKVSESKMLNSSLAQKVIFGSPFCSILGTAFGMILGAWPGVLLRWGMAGIEELEEDLEEIFGVRRFVITTIAIILLVLYYLLGLWLVIRTCSGKLKMTKRNRTGGKFARKSLREKKKEKKLKEELELIDTPPWKLMGKKKKQ